MHPRTDVVGVIVKTGLASTIDNSYLPAGQIDISVKYILRNGMDKIIVKHLLHKFA